MREQDFGIHKKYKKELWGRFLKAIKDYRLLSAGDSVAVCISGGKDSMLMAKLFSELHKYRIYDVEVRYICMDPGYSPANKKAISENAGTLGIPLEIFTSDIFASVEKVSGSPCYLCARMRRGYLYSYAKSAGCNKIALGHHYDDVIETVLMGMLYGAQMQSMRPKLKSTNFRGMELIRPMYLIREDDIKAWRDDNDLKFLRCACRFTEMSETDEMLSKRNECKELIRSLKKTNPDVDNHIFKSTENVCLDTLLSWKTGGEKRGFLDDYG